MRGGRLYEYVIHYALGADNKLSCGKPAGTRHSALTLLIVTVPSLKRGIVATHAHTHSLHARRCIRASVDDVGHPAFDMPYASWLQPQCDLPG